MFGLSQWTNCSWRYWCSCLLTFGVSLKVRRKPVNCTQKSVKSIVKLEHFSLSPHILLHIIIKGCCIKVMIIFLVIDNKHKTWVEQDFPRNSVAYTYAHRWWKHTTWLLPMLFYVFPSSQFTTFISAFVVDKWILIPFVNIITLK